MNHNCDLNEGMTRGALDHLVQPLISVDEYESKISDRRAIVVGFYVDDEHPANDLSNFIDRGSQPVLDTEVSPAPTPDGYFVVFVEIKRDEEFPKILMELLKDVNNISNVRDWSFTCPLHDGPIELTEDSLRKNLTLDDEKVINPPDDIDDTEATDKDDLKEDIGFWLEASADSVVINEGRILICKDHRYYQIDMVDDDGPGIMNLNENNGSKLLQHVLGPGYVVWDMGTHLMVEHRGKNIKIRLTH